MQVKISLKSNALVAFTNVPSHFTCQWWRRIRQCN